MPPARYGVNTSCCEISTRCADAVPPSRRKANTMRDSNRFMRTSNEDSRKLFFLITVPLFPTRLPEIHEAFPGRVSGNDCLIQIHTKSWFIWQGEASVARDRPIDDGVAHPRLDHI